MKKRIISIFLIISIIASLFAISAVSTSAYSKTTSAPKLVSVLPYNGKLNVNWTHNGYATTAYCVWLHEFGRPVTEWKKYYTVNKYINISGLKPNTNYNIKVSAKDKNGNHSKYSTIYTANKAPVINPTPKITYEGKKYNQTRITCLPHFYTTSSLYYYYRLEIKNRENNSTWYCTQRHNSYCLDNKKGYTTYKVQIIYEVGKTRYVSSWSNRVGVWVP